MKEDNSVQFLFVQTVRMHSADRMNAQTLCVCVHRMYMYKFLHYILELSVYYLKVQFTKKIQIWSLFSHHYVIPKLYEFLEEKRTCSYYHIIPVKTKLNETKKHYKCTVEKSKNFHAKFHVFSRNSFARGNFLQISVHNIIKHPHINRMDYIYSILIVFFLFCGHYKWSIHVKNHMEIFKNSYFCVPWKNITAFGFGTTRGWVNNDWIFISGAIKTSNGRIQLRNTHRAKVPCQHLGNSNDLIRLAGLI